MKVKIEAVSVSTLFMIFLLSSLLQHAFAYETGSFDGNFNVDVKVYVLALEGVGFSGVGDINAMIEGALRTCDLSFTNGSIIYRWPCAFWGEYREIRLNLTVICVSSWNVYKQIVESEEKAIMINAHGEILPVPHGYSEEGWIAKIAGAMLERRMTWAHTANYPLKYSWKEDTNTTAELGLAGFRTLMSYIGLNVTGVDCLPPISPTELIAITPAARDSFFMTWSRFADAAQVQYGCPLNGSIFKDYVVQSIWGRPDQAMTGAVIAYKNLSQGNHGFYVHVGTNATFTGESNPRLTNGDWLRGYVASAASIYAVAISAASEQAVAQAESAIRKAEEEGRTVGLEDARSHLEEAQGYFEKYVFSPLIASVYYSIDAAENAQKPPSPLQQYALPIAMLAVVGTAVTALTIKRKRGK